MKKILKDLSVVSFFGAIAWACFQMGYASGAESEKCHERHSYHYMDVRPAFLAVKK